jgi:hypothetical protein
MEPAQCVVGYQTVRWEQAPWHMACVECHANNKGLKDSRWRLMVGVLAPLWLAEVPGECQRWKYEGDAGAGESANQRVKRPIVWRQQREEPDQQRCTGQTCHVNNMKALL